MRATLQVRIGASFRRVLRFRQPDLTYLNLTGYTFTSGFARRVERTQVQACVCTVAADKLSVTISLAGGSNNLPEGSSHLVWFVDWVDPLGNPDTLIAEFIDVLPKIVA